MSAEQVRFDLLQLGPIRFEQELSGDVLCFQILNTQVRSGKRSAAGEREEPVRRASPEGEEGKRDGLRGRQQTRQ